MAGTTVQGVRQDSARRLADDVQSLYATILAAGMYAGLAILLVTFTLYISGAVAPAVPVERLPEYWTLGVEEYLRTINVHYLHRTHVPTGWWWLTALYRGDCLNFLGIALLSSVTIACFVGITPRLLRRRDLIYAAMAVAEVLVLGLAASGILGPGAHG